MCHDLFIMNTFYYAMHLLYLGIEQKYQLQLASSIYVAFHSNIC